MAITSVINWNIAQDDNRNSVRITIYDNSQYLFSQDFMVNQSDDLNTIVNEKIQDVINNQLVGG